MMPAGGNAPGCSSLSTCPALGLGLALALVLLSVQYPLAGAAVLTPAAPPLLFVDGAVLTHNDLTFRLHPPVKGETVVSPTEPWESWAVFAYNHVLQVEDEVRLYYDCIAASSAGKIGPRAVCLATSKDGVHFVKPSLGLVAFNGSKDNNIVAQCAGPSVFVDTNPSVPASQRFKMTCSNQVWAGPDGIRFAPLYNHSSIHHEDDTKDTAAWLPDLGRYVIYVRRDIQLPHRTSGVVRNIGRCLTDDLSNWEKFTPEGCPVVFGPDATDPDLVDVYTNSYTFYEGVHLFFPSFYHHFGSNPFGFGNDGILDIRFVASRDGSNLTYVPSADGRRPFVPLGINRCGATRSRPSVSGGWCDPSNGELNSTSVDTSAAYMASGYIESTDGQEVYLYSSEQPMTHGGDAAAKTWQNNTGIRVLRSRKHGFASLKAPYVFNIAIENMPSFTTMPLKVPTNCPSGSNKTVVQTSCTYESEGKCDAPFHTWPCRKDADCDICPSRPGNQCTCHGKPATCVDGVCKAKGVTGGTLCVANSTVSDSGVGLAMNVETSVVGFVLAEIVGVSGKSLADAVPTRGNTIGALASWQNGAAMSLAALAGKEVQVRVAAADADIFSLQFVCFNSSHSHV